ncbi:MAG: chromate transporter [Clostridium sp.]
MKKQFTFIESMIKVGVIGFGGGNALIPVLEQEVVNEKKLVSKDEYDKSVIAATLTPGALPVEIASGIGLHVGGIGGMLAGGVLMALPGVVFTVLYLMLLSGADSNILQQIQYASIGITAFILCLLTQYIVQTLKSYRHSKFRVAAWFVILFVFIATGGNYLCRIFGLEIRLPKFSTIQILLLTLLGSVVVGLLYQKKVKKKDKSQNWQPENWGQTFVMGFISAFILSAGTFMMWRETAGLVGQGAVSSFLSFGGGDAYLSIADGLFVPEYISESDFYNHLVVIVNVLPGSILCKTLAGIGYLYGKAVVGTTAGGFAFAVAGFACSVACSCFVFYLVYHLYDRLEGCAVFKVIKKAIRVVVSGLLLTVMTGLLLSEMEINSNPAIPRLAVPGMIAFFYFVNLILYHRKWKNLGRIVVSLVLAFLLCNVLEV